MKEQIAQGIILKNESASNEADGNMKHPSAQPPLGIIMDNKLSMGNSNGACPLCGKTKHMRKAKKLYGHMVCPKCYYGFANRRQFAYILDLIRAC